MNKEKVIAVVGPTASGKSSLGVKLAKHFNGEIVSCDSMQIYKGLDIGTAKPTKDEMQGIPHHLIDFKDIYDRFSVANYVELAERVISEMESRDKLPVIVGGTGLYARSLLNSSAFEDESRNDEVRSRLEKECEENGVEALYERLKQIDPQAAEHIHPNNTKRLIRALEFYKVTGQPISSQVENTEKAEKKYNYLMFCLDFRDREKLYERINLRVDEMLETGLLEEARAFYNSVKASDEIPTAAQAIGYKELFPFFDGKVSLEEATVNLKRGTRRYAKRQLTWFRKEESIEFIYVDDFKSEKELVKFCIKRVKGFLNNQEK